MGEGSCYFRWSSFASLEKTMLVSGNCQRSERNPPPGQVVYTR